MFKGVSVFVGITVGLKVGAGVNITATVGVSAMIGTGWVGRGGAGGRFAQASRPRKYRIDIPSKR